METTYFGVLQMLTILEGTPRQPGIMADKQQPVQKVVLPLTRIIPKLQEVRESYQKTLFALVKQFEEVEDREINDALVNKLVNENEEFKEQLEEIFNTEIELNVPLINPIHLVNTSVAEMMILEPLLSENGQG